MFELMLSSILSSLRKQGSRNHQELDSCLRRNDTRFWIHSWIAGTTIVALFFFISSSFAEEVKKPVVAGQFYSADPKYLSNSIDEYLNKADPALMEGDVKVLISPHAGYEFSGPVAGFGYKTIAKKPYKTVVVLGPSHYVAFPGVSVYPQGSFETPLGKIPLDEDFIKLLMASSSKIKYFPPAYIEEHSVEVQLPFLQKVLGGFKLVPIIFGNPLSFDDLNEIASSLANVIKDREDVLVVASSDMSHYHPYQVACEMDSKTLSYLENFDIGHLYSEAEKGNVELCGLSAVVTGMLYAKKIGVEKLKILKYANSGDTQPFTITKGVVGYTSAVIYQDKKKEAEETVKEKKMLSEIQRKTLLHLAREAIKTYLNQNKVLEVTEDDPVLNKKMGAFVTLHKAGQLRGCIGNIVGTQPLYLTVRDMAIASATDDPRFPAVTIDELNNIDIEISVLSEPQKVTDPNLIEMGKHGVIVRSGFRSGVFLPQVATETGWGREAFLSNLCEQKAGLPADAWKKKGVDLFTFTAEVFLGNE